MAAFLALMTVATWVFVIRGVHQSKPGGALRWGVVGCVILLVAIPPTILTLTLLFYEDRYVPEVPTILDVWSEHLCVFWSHLGGLFALAYLLAAIEGFVSRRCDWVNYALVFSCLVSFLGFVLMNAHI